MRVNRVIPILTSPNGRPSLTAPKLHQLGTSLIQIQILKYQVLLQTSGSTAHMPHLSFAGDSIILSSAQELGPAQPGSVLQRVETGMECVAIMPLSFDVCVFLVSKVAAVLQVEFKTYHWVRKTLEVNCYCGSLTLLGESCA